MMSQADASIYAVSSSLRAFEDEVEGGKETQEDSEIKTSLLARILPVWESSLRHYWELSGT